MAGKEGGNGGGDRSCIIYIHTSGMLAIETTCSHDHAADSLSHSVKAV
jgi:hypothetical protein